MMVSGICDKPMNGSENDDEETELTPEEEADDVIKALQGAKIPSQYRGISGGEQLGDFFRAHGRQKFRLLSKAARSVLGAPASSSVLERDFSEAGKLVNQQRRSLSPAYVEMVMFLCGVYDYIPEVIPKITTNEVDEAIPFRLRNPTVQTELAGLLVESSTSTDEGSIGVVIGNTGDNHAFIMENVVKEEHSVEEPCSLDELVSLYCKDE